MTSENNPVYSTPSGDLAALIGTEVAEAVSTSGGGIGTSALTLKSAKFTQTNAGTLTVVAAVTSKRIKVYAVKLGSSADDMTVKFKSATAGDLEEAIEVDDGGGYIESVNPPAFLFATTAGEALQLVVTGTGVISGRVSYWDTDAT